MGFKVHNTAQEKLFSMEQTMNMFKNFSEQVVRGYDGSSNNLDNPDWGRAGTNLLRISKQENSTVNPNPRAISNEILKTVNTKKSNKNFSDFVWGWGQFLDHEISITPTGSESNNIITPSNDDFPGRTIEFTNSVRNGNENPNDLSSYIDATNVYGNTYERAYALRRLDGSGKLKLENNLLPLNVSGMENARHNETNSFLAGDVRANENVLLTALHTLFVREHNRLCDELTGPEEMRYQKARRIVTAQMQVITYNEFLPLLIGDLPEYSGYNSNVNAGISTEFSTVGYRLGHTMVSSNLNINGTSVPLRELFFNPNYIKENGIEGVLLGASNQTQQEIDRFISEELRTFLFDTPTSSNLLDLGALNIQRGRDHQIPRYNALRNAYGLPSKTINQLTNNVSLRNKLTNLYNNADNIDSWVGGLIESHLPGKSVGELFNAILTEQFIRLRDGDRFWWENDLFLEEYKQELHNLRLSDIINRNCNVNVKQDVFRN